MQAVRICAIWAVVMVALVVPLALAARSPLLAWREPVYILAGFAGIAGLSLLMVQPLLARDALPGLTAWQGRQTHRLAGTLLVGMVLVHVGGLWLTSPPDVVDALLFASPTPFSAWGVLAMWAVFAAGALALLRRRLQIRPTLWRRAHLALVGVAVATTIPHALMIDGTMEPISRAALCAAVAGVFALVTLRGRRR